jgi:hypothetical protein
MLMLGIDCPFWRSLKMQRRFAFLSPDYTTLFLCACPKQLEPVWQDGQSTDFQARTPGRGQLWYNR